MGFDGRGWLSRGPLISIFSRWEKRQDLPALPMLEPEGGLRKGWVRGRRGGRVATRPYGREAPLRGAATQRRLRGCDAPEVDLGVGGGEDVERAGVTEARRWTRAGAEHRPRRVVLGWAASSGAWRTTRGCAPKRRQRTPCGSWDGRRRRSRDSRRGRS